MRTVLCLLCVLVAPMLARAQEEQPAPEPPAPRYLEAMRSELAAMRVRDAECAADDVIRAHCSFRARGVSTGREFQVHLHYSDNTDTIYVYVERFLVLPDDGPQTPAVIHRLLEINWTMLATSFEWNPTDGEVRLKSVLNTDSNFDRRAFRSVVRNIVGTADRWWPELDRLSRGQANAAAH